MQTCQSLLRCHQLPLCLQPTLISQRQSRYLIGQFQLKQLATHCEGITELEQMLLNQTAGSGDAQNSSSNKDDYNFGTSPDAF